MTHDDNLLMGRLQAGDEQAMSVLLEEHWTSVVKYAFRLVGSWDKAEDVAQDAFVRVWEGRKKWSRGSLGALVHRIARNAALDVLKWLRSRSGRRAVRARSGGREGHTRDLPASRGDLQAGGGPGMGDDLEVKVLPEPGRRDRREAQGVRREAYAERSVKRTRESTNRNRIRGAADRGERTTDREAPATKGKRRRSGDCAGKVIVLTRGGLA